MVSASVWAKDHGALSLRLHGRLFLPLLTPSPAHLCGCARVCTHVCLYLALAASVALRVPLHRFMLVFHFVIDVLHPRRLHLLRHTRSALLRSLTEYCFESVSVIPALRVCVAVCTRMYACCFPLQIFLEACGVLLFLCVSLCVCVCVCTCVLVRICESHLCRDGQGWFPMYSSSDGTPTHLSTECQVTSGPGSVCLSGLSSSPSSMPLLSHHLACVQTYLLPSGRTPQSPPAPQDCPIPFSPSSHRLEPVWTGPHHRCLTLILSSPCLPTSLFPVLSNTECHCFSRAVPQPGALSCL